MGGLAIIVGLVATACNKNGLSHEYTAKYKFEVSDEIGTKGILNSPGSITWEEGDKIYLYIQVYDESDWALYVMGEKTMDTIEGSIVYENGSWTTYVAENSSLVKTDRITVTSPSLDCTVSMRFSYTNRTAVDPDHFISSWVRTIPFAQGRQSIEVKLPFVEE